MRDVSAAVYVAALAVQEGLSRKKASFGYCLDEDEHPRISRTDQQFEEKGLEFVWGMDELSIDELNDLFVRVSRSACMKAARPSVASRCQHHVRSSARLKVAMAVDMHAVCRKLCCLGCLEAQGFEADKGRGQVELLSMMLTEPLHAYTSKQIS